MFSIGALYSGPPVWLSLSPHSPLPRAGPLARRSTPFFLWWSLRTSSCVVLESSGRVVLSLPRRLFDHFTITVAVIFGWKEQK